MEHTSTTIDAFGREAAVLGDHPGRDARVRDLLDVLEIIRPVIAADGGSLDLLSVDIDQGIVRLQLSGACGSCAVSAATLNEGVARIMKTRLEWVTEVDGSVEESDIDGLGGWVPKFAT
ncbi:MAG: NifU family protein [Ilumatobacteraceae bacterium]